MEQELLKYIATQGVFAALFVYLLFYVLKTSSKREENYQVIIQELSTKFNIIENIQDDIKEVKECVRGK